MLGFFAADSIHHMPVQRVLLLQAAGSWTHSANDLLITGDTAVACRCGEIFAQNALKQKQQRRTACKTQKEKSMQCRTAL